MSLVNQLTGALVGKYSGPVLVVGGAPSVPEELAWLRERRFDFDNCLIVSANEHAARAGLKPHYAVVNDNEHSELKVQQEPRMRALMPETKLLSRHWWADYRSPQLMACNSGLKALLYAAILGANPIVVIGIQHYRDKQLYFHHDGRRTGANPNQARAMGHFTQQTDRIQPELRGVPVRTVSGPLTKLWPQWQPQEKFEPRGLCELEREALSMAADTRHVCAVKPGASMEGALIQEGAVFAVTAGELPQVLHSDALVEATGWDFSDTNAAFAKHLEHMRREHARKMRMVAKVRGHPRSVRRGIYDADLMRIIQWTESGESAEAIARRIGLPKEQVIFMVATMGAKHAQVAADRAGIVPDVLSAGAHS